VDSKDQLGEAPFWDEHRRELLRVDITRGRVHGWSPSSGATWCREYDDMVSAVIPRVDSPEYVIAQSHRLVLDNAGALHTLTEVETDRPHNRFNDCKCDPRCRLWAGTMSMIRSPAEAALYRISGDGQTERVIQGTTISNGIGWNPAGDLMYFIDSTTQRIDVLDFDPYTGSVDRRRRFASIEPSDGLPDGLTVDEDGGVWVCLFGGAAIRRYNEDGALDAHVTLPVTNPTSPTFGDAGLRTLYITSARHKLSPDQLRAEPLAGALLAFDPGVAGLPGNRLAA
jgi:sugar lactone lactonase YvrE